MALKCDNCGKGISYGHMVSPAKNRLKRLFKPNLQKIPVLRSGKKVVARLCAKCIKRLKKSGRTGNFSVLKQKSVAVKEILVKQPKTKSKVKKPEPASQKKEQSKPSMDISSIVGKKS